MSLVLTAALLMFDGPNFTACEAAPWQKAQSNFDLIVEDHPLGTFDGHEARLRVCAEFSGYGYWRLAMVVWVAQDDGTFLASHIDLNMTACVSSTAKRRGDIVTVETTACSYHDDPDDPAPVNRTRLHWQDQPPSFEAQ